MKRRDGMGRDGMGRNVLISVSTSSNSRSMAARSSYETGVSSSAAAMAAVVNANLWGIRVGSGVCGLYVDGSSAWGKKLFASDRRYECSVVIGGVR